MNSFLRFLTIAMIASLAISQTTTTSVSQVGETFANPTSLNSATTSAVPHSNGYVVTLTGAGWIYGDPIVIIPGQVGIVWATLLQNTAAGTTSIGLLGSNCVPPITSSTATLQNTAANACPADFSTVYTATPTGTSTTDVTTLATVGNPIEWLITQPATSAGNVVGVAVLNNGVLTTPSTATASSITSTNTQRYATANLRYALYIQTTTAATVCVQTNAQYVRSPANCGETLFIVGQTDQSAGILSTTVCLAISLIALIFFQ